MVARARPESRIAGIEDRDGQAISGELARRMEPAITGSDDRDVDLARHRVVRRLRPRGIPPIGLRLPVPMEGDLGHGRSGLLDTRDPSGGAGRGTSSHALQRSRKRPMRRTRLSSKARPTSCTARGKPSGPSPTGTVMAGCPVTLNMFA